MALLVAAEINGRLGCQREASHHADLFAIGAAAVIFPPSGFLSEAEQIRSGDVVMVAGFRAPKPREK